nr:DUF1232 domain-containing protein [Treponema sp.]
MFGIKKNAKKELERLKKSEWSEDDAQKVLQSEKRLDKITLAPALKECAADVKLFFAMLKDFVTKKYPYLPLRVCIVVAGALAYLFAPLDFLPDFLPAMGFLDDAALVALCVKFAAQDIDDYKTWLSSKGCDE